MLLSEWESREEQWREIESILRRGINRLAVIASGADPIVDQHLAHLRSTIRGQGGLDDVAKMLDTVSVTAGRISTEDDRGGSGEEARNHSHAPVAESTYAPQAKGNQEPAVGADEQPPMLQATEGQRGVVSELAEELHITLSTQACDLGVQPDPHAAFQSALLDVFGVMPIPDDLTDRAQQIQEKLKAGIPAIEYPGFLDSVAEFCVKAQKAIHKYTNDIQDFLWSITERLQEIDKSLHQRIETVDQSVRHTTAMSESVQTELRNIAHSTDIINDVDTLKNAVQSRLKRIESTITTHLNREKQQARRSGNEIKRLLSRLDELEREASTLRLQVSQARAKASFDSLTGLYNRASFDSRFTQEIVRCTQKQTGLALVLLDIDNFTNINNSLGRQAGDRVLEALGKLLTEQTNYSETAARLEADRFALLLGDTDVERASKVAQQVRQTFDRARFYHRGAEVPVTLSGAVTEFRSGDDPQTMISRAAQGLRRAQSAGGNHVHTDDNPTDKTISE